MPRIKVSSSSPSNRFPPFKHLLRHLTLLHMRTRSLSNPPQRPKDDQAYRFLGITDRRIGQCVAVTHSASCRSYRCLHDCVPVPASAAPERTRKYAQPHMESDLITITSRPRLTVAFWVSSPVAVVPPTSGGSSPTSLPGSTEPRKPRRNLHIGSSHK